MKIIQLLKETTDGVQNVLHCLSSVSVLQLTLFACELRESHCTNTWLLYLFIHVSNTYIYLTEKATVLTLPMTGFYGE